MVQSYYSSCLSHNDFLGDSFYVVLFGDLLHIHCTNMFYSGIIVAITQPCLDIVYNNNNNAQVLYIPGKSIDNSVMKMLNGIL